MTAKMQIKNIIGRRGWCQYAENFDQIVNTLVDYAIIHNGINLAMLHSTAKSLNKKLVANPTISEMGIIETIIVYGCGHDKVPAYTFNNGKLVSFDLIAR